MVSMNTLAERMARAARELQGESDPQAMLQAAVRLAAENVGGSDAAAITIREPDGRLHTQAFTDELALRCDLLQYELGEGPCLDALESERLVATADLTEEARWPAWAKRVAEEHGVRSMLCIQLFTYGGTLGALNLYARRTDAFDDEAVEDAEALAAHIAVALAAARKEDEFAEALKSRTVIAQACGMLMERYGLDADRAFQVLVRVSSQGHVKVRDLARELVDTGRLPDVPDQ